MESTLAQILLGVFTNAISSVLEEGWRSANAEDDTSLEDALDAVVERLTEVDCISEDVGGQALVGFLESPETTALVRALFVYRVHGERVTETELRTAFERAFARLLPNADAVHASRLFDALASGVETIVSAAAARGEPAAAHAVQARQFRVVTEELAGVRASLERLTSFDGPEEDEVLRWEQFYRTQVLARHGTITPPSFDAAERVSVDSIYVESRFALPGGADVGPRHVNGDELARELYRTVVLGDPGAGKSTYAQKLTYDLVRQKTSLPGGSLTPFLVILKDYGAERARTQISLVDWIERVLNADYHAPPPSGGVEYLLNSGRAMVILDGLDELLDTSDRRAMTASVETFSSRFVAAPILVTSRQVGYAQAPLDIRQFWIAELEELEEEQVDQYAHLWFGLREELTEEAATRMANDFIRDSADAASDLRRNTLMLALLCNIYRGDGYIPRRRPQVYAKCALMLFERWDRGRRIVVELDFDRHLRPAMQHLAHWIYAEGSLKGGVTESELIRRASGFLLERRFDDEDVARAEATKFVEFCRGRAWVFTDTGTTPDGERLYQFTHRTFLEFFTAEHLVRTHRTPDELLAVLGPRVQAGEWDVVAQLAVQLQDDNMDGAGDDLIHGLLAGQSDLVLSFVARCLAFLVPRRQTCVAVSRAVTRRACEWIVEQAADTLVEGESAAEAFRSLVNCDIENVAPVARGISEEARTFVQERGDRHGALAALEVACACELALSYDHRRDVAALWTTAQVEAFGTLWESVEPFKSDVQAVAYDAFLFGRLALEELLDDHGVSALFVARTYSVYDAHIRTDLSQLLLDGWLGLGRRPGGGSIGTLEEFAAMGRALGVAVPPWDTKQVMHAGQPWRFEPSIMSPTSGFLEGDALLGAIGALIVVAERSQEAGDGGQLLEYMAHWAGWMAGVRPWIAQRLRADSGTGEVGVALPFEARQLLDGWSQHKWSATTVTDARRTSSAPSSRTEGHPADG